MTINQRRFLTACIIISMAINVINLIVAVTK